MEQQYSLMIHGGAGAILPSDAYRESLSSVLAAGEAMLKGGAAALDVVEHCVTLLEDDPLYNAGRGSVLTHDGAVEMDAAIMDGATLRAGAVAAVVGIKNPIALARAVMDKSEHVMLIGSGAEQFAQSQGFATMDEGYFLTEARVQQLAKALKQDAIVLDHSDVQTEKFGTVGAVARDTSGNLAAATSTGGMVNKRFGRVGDTPIIGAGTYAENGVCAVSCTGFGEQFLRTVLAKTAASLIEHKGLDAPSAADAAIAELVRKVQGLGGLILIDAHGECGCAYSTPGILAGQVRAGEAARFW